MQSRLIILWYILQLSSSYSEAIQKFNLTSKCNLNQQKTYCAISNIYESYDEPLLFVNSSQTQLTELIVHTSKLRGIPRDLFTLAPNLNSLIFYDCGLNRVDAGNLKKAQNLKKLIIQVNSFFDVGDETFSTLYELEHLSMARNTINMLHSKAFNKLNKLRYLDLQKNNINSLPETVFAELYSLEHIDLSYNEITLINAQMFANNSQLKTVILANNKFHAFQPYSLHHLPHLHLLDLSNSNVGNINLQSVDNLLLQNSNLKSCAVEGSVMKLQLNNNQLISGSLQIGNKLAVRELDVHGNHFATLDDLQGMNNLQRLDMSNNQLTTLELIKSPYYVPLPSLTFLNLASNLLSNLSSTSFMLLSKLTHLDLAFNRLKLFNIYALKPLSSLEKLYIEGNHLNSLDYEKMCQNHMSLHEIGIFNNDYNIKYLHKMLSFFKEHYIQLPVRFISTATSDAYVASSSNYNLSESDILYNAPAPLLPSSVSLEQNRQLLEVSGIHPYWTKRDVLTMAILVFVLLILLLQMYQLLREEAFWQRCCSRQQALRSRRGRDAQNRPQRMQEDDSEV